MRAVLVAAAALTALTVSGCDIHTTPKTAKVDCNCTVPPQAAATPTPVPDMRGSSAYEPPEQPYRHRVRYRAHGPRHGSGGDHGYYWRREYSELSVYTYEYHGGSSSTYVGTHGGASGGVTAYAYAASGAGAGAYAVVPSGWIDGYGHAHGGHGGAYTGEPTYHNPPATGAPVHYETGGRDRGRMSAWHGYGADCPDDDHDHHGHH